MNKSLHSQKTLHTMPSRASYGVSVVRNFEKIDHAIMAPHFISNIGPPSDQLPEAQESSLTKLRTPPSIPSVKFTWQINLVRHDQDCSWTFQRPCSESPFLKIFRQMTQKSNNITNFTMFYSWPKHDFICHRQWDGYLLYMVEIAHRNLSEITSKIFWVVRLLCLYH